MDGRKSVDGLLFLGRLVRIHLYVDLITVKLFLLSFHRYQIQFEIDLAKYLHIH
jgi:hypothetical protein